MFRQGIDRIDQLVADAEYFHTRFHPSFFGRRTCDDRVHENRRVVSTLLGEKTKERLSIRRNLLNQCRLNTIDFAIAFELDDNFVSRIQWPERVPKSIQSWHWFAIDLEQFIATSQTSLCGRRSRRYARQGHRATKVVRALGRIPKRPG